MSIAHQTTLTLTAEATRRIALERLANHLPLQAAGYECCQETVLDVLLQAATRRQTIETVCNSLEDIVTGETVRGYLNAQIRVDDLSSLEAKVNETLGAGLPRRLFKVKLHIALDFHDEPFYGHSPELVAYAYRFCQLKQKRGPRKIDLRRFELQRLIRFLNHAIEKVYTPVLSIQADISPLGV